MTTLDITGRRPARARLLDLGLMRFEFLRVLRNKQSIAFTLVFPIAMFLFISSSIPEKSQKLGADMTANVSASVMVNMALYGAIMAATSAGAAVAVERDLGWSRQLRLTPLRPVSYIVAKMLAALVMSTIATGMTFATGAISGMAKADPMSWALSGAVVVAGSLVFAAFGLLIGYLLPSDSAMQYLGGLLALMSMLGGIFFPIDEGTTFDRIASFTPMYGFGKAAQWPLSLDHAGGFSAFHASWAISLVVWACVFVFGAAWCFRRDTQRV